MHNKIYRNEPEYRQNYRNGTKCAEVDQYDAGNFKNEQKYYQNKSEIPQMQLKTAELHQSKARNS